MPIEVTFIIIAVVALAVGWGLAAVIQAKGANSRTNRAKREAEQILKDAQKQADLDRRAANVEAKEAIEKRRKELEDEYKDRQTKLADQEKRLNHREETLEKRSDLLERQENDQKRRDKELDERRHLQINMLDADVLRDAQKHPHDYRHLLVRVTGYNAYFTTIGRELQNEVIARISHDQV